MRVTARGGTYGTDLLSGRGEREEAHRVSRGIFERCGIRVLMDGIASQENKITGRYGGYRGVRG
jgi:hypothetical protein